MNIQVLLLLLYYIQKYECDTIEWLFEFPVCITTLIGINQTINCNRVKGKAKLIQNNIN